MFGLSADGVRILQLYRWLSEFYLIVDGRTARACVCVHFVWVHIRMSLFKSIFVSILLCGRKVVSNCGVRLYVYVCMYFVLSAMIVVCVIAISTYINISLAQCDGDTLLHCFNIIMALFRLKMS